MTLVKYSYHLPDKDITVKSLVWATQLILATYVDTVELRHGEVHSVYVANVNQPLIHQLANTLFLFCV